MSRDKLITIRIEESKRNAFRQWAKKNKIDGATFLYRVIGQCIDNKLSTNLINTDIVEGKSLKDIQTSIQQLYKKFEEKNIEQNSKITNLQSQIDELKSEMNTQDLALLDTQRVNNSQDDLLERDSKITNLQSHLQSYLQSQIDDLKAQFSTQRVDKRVGSSQDNLLSDRQLAEILGVTPTTVNRWRTKQRKPSKQHQNIFDQYEVIKDKWKKI